MNKNLLKLLPSSEDGFNHEVSFPILCQGDEKDALSVSVNKELLCKIKSEKKAGLAPSILNNADDYSVLVSKIVRDMKLSDNANNPLTLNGTWINAFIKLVGGDRYYSAAQYEPRVFNNINWQHWNELQSLFISDPFNFKSNLASSGLMTPSYLHSRATTSGFEISPTIGEDYKKSGQSFQNISSSLCAGDRKYIFETTDVFKDSVSLFDLMHTLSKGLSFTMKDANGFTTIGSVTEKSFRNFVLSSANKKIPYNHEQFTLSGQFLKTEANRNSAQSDNPKSTNTFDLGTVTNLFNRKSDDLDRLSDSFSKLFSLNYPVSFRGIFSGALFIQLDDFTHKYSKDIENKEGYISFFKQFCGGEDFLNNHIISDLNLEGRQQNMTWVKSAHLSLAKEFSIINIHTKKAYLVSIGEHRFNGQELWRYDNRHNHPRQLSADSVTDSLVLDNSIVTKLVSELDPLLDPREVNSPQINHVFSTKSGRAITSIHALDDSSCLTGASMIHTPFSGLNDENADDDKDATQQGLNFTSVQCYDNARRYELVKGLEQKVIITGIISSIFKMQGSIIRDVLDFDIDRAVLRSSSTLDLATTKTIIRSLVSKYHNILWCATHASEDQLIPSNPAFILLPTGLKDWIISELASNADLSHVRSLYAVTSSYGEVMNKMLTLCNELDTNDDSNIVLSQSLQEYAFHDGGTEYTPWKAEFNNTNFVTGFKLHQFCFINLGATVSIKPSFNGIPQLTDAAPQVPGRPHTLPLDGSWSWKNPIRESFVNEFTAHLIAGDVSHNGSKDTGREAVLLCTPSEIITFDANQLFFDINTLRSLPLLCLDIIKDRVSPFYKINNPLFGWCYSLKLHEKVGLVTNGRMRDSFPQTDFNFNLDESDFGQFPITKLLSFLAAMHGVTNFSGKTGVYLSSLDSPVFDAKGKLIYDKRPIYLRDLACAIYADTNIIPSTVTLAKDIIGINQRLFNLDFYHHTGMNPSLFDNASKSYLVNRSHSLNKAAFHRITSLFLYENYK